MTSLLILTQPIQKIRGNIFQILEASASYASKHLFIHVDDLSIKESLPICKSLSYNSNLISTIYSLSPAACPGIDIRVLLCGFKQLPFSLNLKLNHVLTDSASNSSSFKIIEEKYSNLLDCKNFISIFGKLKFNEIHESDTIYDVGETQNKVYDEVVLGGTFDQIHPGHKILLSEAALRCKKKFTVGIADGPLLKRKTLKELILPSTQRMKDVEEFIANIDPTLKLFLTEIEEPMGPTAYDPNLELLIVSEETEKGIKMINDYRIENGLKKLDAYSIKLFEDCQKQSDQEETKYSSSSQRMRLLGSRIREIIPNSSIPELPYIIGLTGGISSGKSSIAKKLQELGAAVIDCDKLGHKAYMFGTPCYAKLVETFGKEIVNEESKEINRKILGAIVFNDKEKLKLLTDIVWPSIADLAHHEIEEHKTGGKKIVVLDAAVLLEAKWHQFCHEVWVCIISREEAIKRIVDRDKLAVEAAEKRIDNQLTNEERLTKADIVFCTQWSYSYTHSQIEKAWDILKCEGKL